MTVPVRRLSLSMITLVGVGGDTLDLAGEWRLRLDAEDQGIPPTGPRDPLRATTASHFPTPPTAPGLASRSTQTRCSTRLRFP